jgi:hypothetical protein
MNAIFFGLFLFLLIHQSLAIVVVNERKDYQYNNFAKLRISGQGFTGSSSDYHLSFVPELQQGKDFVVEVVSENVLNLKLLANKKWIKTGPLRAALSWHFLSFESILYPTKTCFLTS